MPIVIVKHFYKHICAFKKRDMLRKKKARRFYVAASFIMLLLIMALRTRSCAREEIYYGVLVPEYPNSTEFDSPKLLFRYYGDVVERLHEDLVEAISICENALSIVETMLSEELSLKLVVNWIPRESVFSANVQYPSTINVYNESFEAFGERLFSHELFHVFANQIRGGEKNSKTRFIEEMFADGLASTLNNNDRLAIRSHYQTWLTIKVDSDIGNIPLMGMLIGDPKSLGHSPLETLFLANSFGAFIAENFSANVLRELYSSLPPQREIQSQTWDEASSIINAVIMSSLNMSTTELECKWRAYLDSFASNRHLRLYEELFSTYYFDVHKPLIASGRINGLISEGILDARIMDEIRALFNELEKIILNGTEPNQSIIDDYKSRVRKIEVSL